MVIQTAIGKLVNIIDSGTIIDIAYDDMGNPTDYYNGGGYEFTWLGRQLVGAETQRGDVFTFTYDSDGLRTSRTVNGVTTTYYYDGGLLIAQEDDTCKLVFIYDESGSPIGYAFRYHDFQYEWETCWYEKNLQGDIVAVYNDFGEKLVSYIYDAWGNFTETHTDTTDGEFHAQTNPFTYRGYYYDHDLQMYYLQTRYYDSAVGRFINADSALYHSMLGYNMFAYCNNNPSNFADYTGNNGEAILTGWMSGMWWINIADGPLPFGEAVFWGVAGVVGVVIVGQSIYNSVADLLENDSSSTVADVPDAPQNVGESSDAKEIGDNDKLPNQGNVTAVSDAPPVEAGKQGKHVPGHNNYDPNKSSWENGENGVRQTQEAWKNSRPVSGRNNVRVGTSSDGRTIEIQFGKKGIHGYPIFP